MRATAAHALARDLSVVWCLSRKPLRISALFIKKLQAIYLMLYKWWYKTAKIKKYKHTVVCRDGWGRGWSWNYCRDRGGDGIKSSGNSRDGYKYLSPCSSLGVTQGYAKFPKVNILELLQWDILQPECLFRHRNNSIRALNSYIQLAMELRRHTAARSSAKWVHLLSQST